MRRAHRFAIATLFLVAASSRRIQAATPPLLVNYQGVLKTVSGAPLTQANMILRLYDTPAGGNLVFEDRHTTLDGGIVTIAASGVFNVAIGSGFILTGPGLHNNLREVFRNRDAVYLSVQVENDVLDPRTRILSAPYALSNPRGVTYTRWGRTTCPNGVETIYDGVAAGERSSHLGGTSSQLCLSKIPSYPTQTSDVDNTGADIYGTEYESTLGDLNALRFNTATCAICFQPDADAVFMYPGSTNCPVGWNQEYKGYLMTNAFNEESKEAICVDETPQAILGNPADDFSNNWYPIEAFGVLLSGQGYVPFREIGCVVCSR